MGCPKPLGLDSWAIDGPFASATWPTRLIRCRPTMFARWNLSRGERAAFFAEASSISLIILRRRFRSAMRSNSWRTMGRKPPAMAPLIALPICCLPECPQRTFPAASRERTGSPAMVFSNAEATGLMTAPRPAYLPSCTLSIGSCRSSRRETLRSRSSLLTDPIFASSWVKPSRRARRKGCISVSLASGGPPQAAQAVRDPSGP